MDATQPARLKDAVLSGEFTGGDPLPQPVRVAGSGMSDEERNQAIRKWAKAQGYRVAARGRLSAGIKEAYGRAHENEPELHSLAA
ncbi:MULTISPECIES: histone-like nucleoid-structuring protein Lsr2 [Streptomyces]|uniref:Lsr2 DNA-binding domain-containing protein n=1 Tax=Streptomyces luteosporeus TaxID=173856 RepID=A0ABP6GAP3_9ACTN